MSEGDVVDQLVNFTNILLAGISVLFTVISAYVVALNYFIGSASTGARIMAFLFVSLILALLAFVMLGAQATQAGLVERLREIGVVNLSAAGRAVLRNATTAQIGGQSIDEIVKLCVWAGLAFIYAALAYMTFLHKWTPDAIPISIESRT